jgi:hypothetical protein
VLVFNFPDDVLNSLSMTLTGELCITRLTLRKDALLGPPAAAEKKEHRFAEVLRLRSGRHKDFQTVREQNAVRGILRLNGME